MPAAIAQFTITDYNDITISTIAPSSPALNQLWLDSSLVPNQLKRWDGSNWSIINQVEVGGRNLLVDSGRVIENSSYNIADFLITENLQDGELVTFRMKAALGGTKTSFRLFNSGGSGTSQTLENKGNGIFEKTFYWSVIGTNSFVRIYVFTSDQIGTSSIEWGKLERGNIATDWTPAPEDIETRVYTAEQQITPNAIVNTFTEEFSKEDTKQITKGIISLDKDGINVGTSESEINSQLAHDGLSVRDGDNTLASFGESGAVIPHADIEVLSSPSVIQMRPSVTVNVGVGYTFTSVNEAINWIFPAGTKILDGFAQINVKSNIAEDITFNNLHGGRVILDIAGRTISGKIRVINCTARVEIVGSSTAYGVLKANNQPVYAENSRNVYMNYLNVNGDGGSYGSLVDYGSLVHMTSCDFVNSSFAVLVSGDAFAIIRDCKGSPAYTGRTQYGGVLMIVGTAPKGTSGYIAVIKGFLIEQGAITQVASSYSPPAVTSQVFTQTFTSATFDTLIHGTSSIDSYYGSTSAQNRWDSGMGWKDGRIRMGSGIYDFFNGGSNISIRYRLRRKNSAHGSSLAVKPAPYNHSTAFSIGALRGGWTSWAAISSSYFGPSGATLTFYNGITGSSGYAIWDAIEVEVTVTKQV